MERKWIWISIVGNVILITLGCMVLFYRTVYYDCRTIMMEGSSEEAPKAKWALWLPFVLLLASQCGEVWISSFALSRLLRQEKQTHRLSHSEDGGGLYHHPTTTSTTHHIHNHTPTTNNHHHPNYHQQRQYELTEEMWSQTCKSWCQC